MESDYNRHTEETDAVLSWKDAIVRGFIIGIIVGASTVAFIGLGVCSNV
jgi:hypothetical protein